jgi:thioredoxin 1
MKPLGSPRPSLSGCFGQGLQRHPLLRRRRWGDTAESPVLWSQETLFNLVFGSMLAQEQPASLAAIKLPNNYIAETDVAAVSFEIKNDYFCSSSKKKIMALEITDATFEETVLKSDMPVVVDFWAAWCGPCRMVGPIIDEISKDYEGKAVVGKVDVDSNQEFAAKYGVRNIPTVLIFKGGELVGRQVGVAPKATYAEAIDKLL